MLEQDESFVRDFNRVHQVETALLPVAHERRRQLKQQVSRPMYSGFMRESASAVLMACSSLSSSEPRPAMR